MTEQTIVAVFDRITDADAAVRELEAASVPSEAISRHERGTETTTTTTAPVREEGFWARLFGSEPGHDTSVYDRSIDNGASVVMVRVPGEQADRISLILESHHPADLDERSTHHGATGTTATDTPNSMTIPPAPRSMASGSAAATPAMTGTDITPAAATSESNTIQLAEETLAVGKRAVQGTTTRIRRFVVETPVEEQVNLRKETVTLERHPVGNGGQVGTADFTDKVVEMTETSEEAVVSKTARVVEEVNLRKDVTDRTETVKETLRRDDVEVQTVPGESVNPRSATTADPRAAGVTGNVSGDAPKI